jgi:hypothetical protein
MKQKILIILLFCLLKIYSQKIEKRIGDIHVAKEEYYFDDLKKSDKRKINKSEYFFNNEGQVLETISYGTAHFNDLKNAGRIEQFFYINNKLDLSKSYSTSCNGCEYHVLYNKYDENNNLISDNSYYEKNDSLFMSTNYIYKPNVKETHFNELTYYERIYDSNNNLLELNQRFEDTKKIRWQRLYNYFDNSTVITFKTKYNDGAEKSEFEIKTYDIEKRLISHEIIGIGKTKKEYFYAINGFLEKIKEYRLNIDGKYEKNRLTKFKVDKKQKYLKPVYLQKINSDLIEEI